MMHIHSNSGITSSISGHLHTFKMNSSATEGQLDSHTHTLIGTTNDIDGHQHSFHITTGPAMLMGPGLHVHRYSGKTTDNGTGPHNHILFGFTTPTRSLGGV